MNIFLDFLININNNYSQLLLFILALFTFWVLYNEYILKRRPFTFPEIGFEENDNSWYFSVFLINSSNFPGFARIKSVILKIGDEEYPTVFPQEIILAPNERKQFLAPIGYINENGRKKIKGHEYVNNRVEISLVVESKSIGDSRYKYKTEILYLVDATKEKPIFSVFSQKFT